MKEILQKIASFSIALIVLLSTFSFTIHQHYCGGELKATSVFFEAEKCEMEKMMVEKECNLHKKRKKCCENVVEVVEGQDELKITFDTLSLEQELFVTSFVCTYTNLLDGSEEREIYFSEYPPPLIVRQIYKLDETYLI